MRSVNSPLLTSYKDLLHAFTTKEGGFSLAPFTGNNLAYHVQDNPNTVDKNHLELSKTLNYSSKKLIHMKQVHGSTIIEINKKPPQGQIPICDALITNQTNIPLMVMVADCLPVLIYDPKKKVIAAVHAGRAGIFSKIIPQTIKTTKETIYRMVLANALVKVINDTK